MLRLQIADPHFSEKPVDAFMWDLIPQVIGVLKNPIYGKISGIDILGDLCHEKDGHSSELINKVVSGICQWADHVDDIKILHGNHDSISTTTPYFKFLEEFEKIRYINEPVELTVPGEKYQWLYLPHTRTPEKDWAHLDFTDRIVFAHVGVDGCLSETGFQMESPISANIFDKAALCMAGDIHQSQIIGKLEYVGSPYATRFGNNDFVGRLLILDTETLKRTPVYLNFPRRLTFQVESMADYEKLKKKYDLNHDQVKIKLNLTMENAGHKRQIESDLKEAIIKDGSTWGGCQTILSEELTPQKGKKGEPAKPKFFGFDQYCAQNNITGAMKQMGLDLIEKAKRL